jgi:(2R)-3-sulfolactate dehydrogenase (NADP+)
MTQVLASVAETAAAALLAASGLGVEQASISARAIVTADRWGVGSHGMLRLPGYLARLSAGGINARATLHLVNQAESVVAYDGEGGMGHWQAWRGAERARDLAKRSGAAVVSIGNSNHCGALGVYALPLLEAGLVALVFSNGAAVMPPWGGSRPVLSTSPLAGAVPSASTPALVDLSTSTVARGRIAERAQRNEPLEPGWALDSAGQPTLDAREALTGMLAPLGGVKGYALAFLVETLTGGIVGPSLSLNVVDFFDAERVGEPQGISHLIIAIDPAATDIDGNRELRLAALGSAVDAGGGRVPGSSRLSAVGANTPVSISDETIGRLRAWVEHHNVPPSDAIGALLDVPR